MFWTMKTPFKTLTPTDLMATIKCLKSLLYSKDRINVLGIKGRIRKLQAALQVTTQRDSSKSIEQVDAKAFLSVGATVQDNS